MTAQYANVDNAPAAQAEQGQHWDMITLPRVGNPPLRFRGRQLSSHGLPPRAEINIDLWQKKKGGYVVSHSVAGREPATRTASAATTIGDAITYLERHCEMLKTHECALDPSRKASLLTMINALQSYGRFKQQFTALAGEALSAWDELQMRSHGETEK